MPKCDLDECSLKDHITEIKDNQKAMTKAHSEMITAQAVFVSKVDGYMETGKLEHEILFARSRMVIKWPHLAMAIGAIAALMAIIFGAIKAFGG